MAHRQKPKWAAAVAGVVPVRVPLDPPVRCHQSINMVSAAHVTTTLWAARAEWAGEVRISDVLAGRRERHRVCIYMYSMWGENVLPYLWSGSEATGTGAVGSCVGAGATWHVNKQWRSCGGETYSGRDYSEMEMHHPEKAAHYVSDDIATLHETDSYNLRHILYFFFTKLCPNRKRCINSASTKGYKGAKCNFYTFIRTITIVRQAFVIISKKVFKSFYFFYPK